MKIFISMAVFYVGFAITFHLNGYLTKHLDLDGLGDFHVALTIATIVAAFCIFGGQAAVHRFIPPYMSKNDWPLAKGFIAHYLTLAAKLSGAAILVALLTAAIFAYLGLEHWLHEAIFAIVITPLLGFSLFTSATVGSLQRPIAAVLPNEVLKPAMLWLGCMIWLELFTTFNEYQVIGILFVVLCLQLAVQVHLMRRALPFDWASTQPTRDTLTWHAVSRPLLYSALANTFLDRVDILALEAIHPNEDSVGVFALLIFVVSPIWMTFSAVAAVIAPRISPLENDISGLQRLFNHSLLSAIAVNLTVALLIGLFSDEILSWFHSDMTAYKPWLFALLAGTAVNCTLETASPFIRFGGQQDKVARLAGYVLIANLIVSPMAIYFLGLEGAILSIIVMSFVRGVGYIYILYRFVGIRQPGFA